MADNLDEWCRQYDNLIRWHKIMGISQFSRDYFSALAQVPGLDTIGAYFKRRLVSATTWIRHQDKAYVHLTAASATSYSVSASYAIYDRAIDHFSDSRLIDFGGVPDNKRAADGGLESFKSGFSNATRTNRLWGCVVDRDRYDALCRRRHIDPRTSVHFPAYRLGSNDRLAK